MRYAIILTLLMFSCSTDPTVTLVGGSEHSTTYIYQDSQCYFAVVGLNNLVEEGQIDAVKLTITAPFGQGTFDFGLADFVNDTFALDLVGDIMLQDSLTENFTDTPIDASFIGQLFLYSDGSIETLTDTIRIDIINPLKGDRQVGKLIDGKRSGEWLEYYDEKLNDLSRKSYFVDGKRDGLDSIFKGGQLYMFCEWTNGQKDGNFFVYWPNGAVKYKTKFADGHPIELLYSYTSANDPIDSLVISR